MCLLPVLADITVNLNDLLIALLIIAGIVALAALASMFFKLAKLLSNLNQTLSIASVDINASLKHLPEVMESLPPILEKVDNSLCDVNKITETAGEAVPMVLDDVTQVTGAVGDTARFVRKGASSVSKGTENLFRSLSVKSARNNSFSDAARLAGMVFAMYKFVNKALKKNKKKTGLFG